MKSLKKYIVRDGDVILTKEGFVFYAVGYDHPPQAAISYLKYIPSELKSEFMVDFIPHEWLRNGRPYHRPKKLYSEENFKQIMSSFEQYHPDYVLDDPIINKKVFAVPFPKIERVFIPQEGLSRLMKAERLDALEDASLELIRLLARESGVPIDSFGIHGSVLTSMHGEKSDMDIAVYGGENFRQVRWTVSRAVERREIEYLFEISTDKFRLNKGRYKGRKFVFNAIRTLDETRNTYGGFQYEPVKQIKFEATITGDSESVFRPASYAIDEWKPLETNSKLEKEDIPKEVFSMIGEFRGMGKIGDQIEVFGMLERVKSLQGEQTNTGVMVGSGKGEEYIRIIS